MDVLVFYFFALLTVFAAAGVLLHPNPVLSALHLVVSMVGVAGLFFLLQAPFIAGVQLAVYAGAVMVLFLIVVMLFNLKGQAEDDFSPGKIANGFKVLFAGMLMGLIASAVLLSFSDKTVALAKNVVENYDVRVVSQMLYTDYMFAFEALGILLLVIPIGTVSLSRIRGGTHAK